MAKKYNYFDDEYESTITRSRKRIKSKVDKQIAQIERENTDTVEQKAQPVSLDLFTVERKPRADAPKPEKKTSSDKKEPKPKAERSTKKTSSATVQKEAKEIFGNALVLAKIGSKKAQKAVKSVARSARTSKLAAKHKVIATLLIILILVGAMVITVFSTLGLVKRENKREVLFNESAAKICMDYEERYGACGYENLEELGVKGYRMTGLCYAREIDFNYDKVSELLVCYNKSGEYFAEVWGFDGDSFVQMYHGALVQTDDIKDDVWLTIYTSGGKNYICEHSEKDVKNASILALHGKKFSKKTVCTYNPESDVYRIKGKDDLESFERIRMSVLRNSSAVNLSDTVQDVVYNFTGQEKGVAFSRTGEQKMLNDYYSVVEQYIELYGQPELKSKSGTDYIDGVAYVDLIDFNSDGVSELVIVFRKPVNIRQQSYSNNYISVTENRYFCDVYSWNGTNAWRVYQHEGLSEHNDNTKRKCLMIKNGEKKKYLCFNSFNYYNSGNSFEASSKILKFDGESFKDSFKAWYCNDYGYREYRIGGEYVSESKFARQNGYQVPFFDGSETYDSKTYTIVYVQADKAHSAVMENMVDRTVENIQKMNKNFQLKAK